MRNKLIAAVAAAALLGGTALAQDRPAGGEWEEGQMINVNGEKKCVCKKPAKKAQKAPVEAAPPATGGSGEMAAPEPAPGPPPEAALPPPPEAQPLPPPEHKEKSTLQGFTVNVGAGVEGYAGALAPQIEPGAGYGVNVGYRPWKMLGFEVGYSGATNELRHFNTSGVDLVRNGGNLLALLGLFPTRIQPYVLGGVGLSRYDFRSGGAGLPFKDDTAGQAPVGGGLRGQFGHFTADLRGSYNFLFASDFALSSGINSGAQYAGTALLGGTF